MHTVPIFLSRAVLVLALSAGASAQSLFFTWPTPAGQPDVGAAGDVDGDGVLDFLHGEGAFTIVSHAIVHSGVDGSTIRTVTGIAADDRFGSVVQTLGDVNLDGRSDFAVAAPQPTAANGNKSYVRAFSGANGNVLWHLDSPDVGNAFGVALALCDDLDLDGRRDLIVGSTSSVFAVPGKVFAVSSATGAVLLTIANLPTATYSFGAAVSGTGDFDGDGRGDWIVGDPDAGAGIVYVCSSANGSVLTTYTTGIPTSSFGATLTDMGDIDGDSVSDVAIGAPNEFHGLYSSGRVRLVSGASGNVLRTWDRATSTYIRYGQRVSRYPDLDGDGRADLCLAEGTRHVGCCTSTTADLVVVSSATGAELARVPNRSSQFAVVPDVDGDGAAEFLVCRTFTDAGVFAAGLVRTGLVPPVVASNCPAKMNSLGSTPYMLPSGGPSLTVGPDCTVNASSLVGNTIGLFAWSTQGASTPFGGGTLCLAGPIHRLPMQSTGGTSGVPNGSMSYTFTKSQLTALGFTAGAQFRVQAWYRDAGFAPPNSIGLTNALVVTIWP